MDEEIINEILGIPELKDNEVLCCEDCFERFKDRKETKEHWELTNKNHDTYFIINKDS